MINSISSPQGVYDCLHSTVENTWRSGGSGSIQITTDVFNNPNGLITGIIHGWCNCSYSFKAKDLECPIVLRTTLHPLGYKVFDRICDYLSGTWQYVVEHSCREMTVSGIMTIESIYEQKQKRFQLYIGPNPKERHYIEAAPFFDNTSR
jgi:hypothetical protein